MTQGMNNYKIKILLNNGKIVDVPFVEAKSPQLLLQDIYQDGEGVWVNNNPVINFFAAIRVKEISYVQIIKMTAEENEIKKFRPETL